MRNVSKTLSLTLIATGLLTVVTGCGSNSDSTVPVGQAQTEGGNKPPTEVERQLNQAPPGLKGAAGPPSKL